MLVGVAAAFGAWLRWLITYFLSTVDPSLPHGTLAVNLIGGLVIGISFAAIQSTSIHVSEELKLILNVGFLGAFTTYSAFSLDTINFLINAQVNKAFLNILLNTALCISAAYFGICMGRFFLR